MPILQVVNWFDNQRRKRSRLSKAAGVAPILGKPAAREAAATGATIDLTERDDQAMDIGERQEGNEPAEAGAHDGSVALRGGGRNDSPPAEDAMEICGGSQYLLTCASILCKCCRI